MLYDARLSGHTQVKLMIGINTKAQGIKYSPDKVILNKFEAFTRINVVSLAILLSQKILAILYRKRPMGRDFYDTIFLLSRTKPDFTYLKIKTYIASKDELKDKLLSRSEQLDFKQLARDIKPFLINEDAKKIL